MNFFFEEVPLYNPARFIKNSTPIMKEINTTMLTMPDHRLVVILTIFIYNLLSASTIEPPSWIDSAETRYAIAAKEYSMDGLQKTAEFITGKPALEQKFPEALLLLGLVFWRQELIAYCSNDAAEINKYGKLAISKLNEAEKAGADIYLTASHKALASQLLASQGINNGMIYGPRAAKELKKAQAARPKGYFSLLVEAVNISQAPSFAGGNPEKAVTLLKKLATAFPDSIDVTTHLSDALIKAGRPEEARELILPVIKTHPSNLLARKVAAGLHSK